MRKHYTLEDWDNAVGDVIRLKYVRTGTGRTWVRRCTRLYCNETGVRKISDILITIDAFKMILLKLEFVAKVREEFPKKTIQLVMLLHQR